VLGAPVSVEHPAGDGYVQYFANGRLEWDAANGVRIGLLGTELATRRGVDTAAVAAPPDATPWSRVVAALVADEADRRALGAAASGGRSFVPEFAEKWVAVSIAQQRVTAYEHTKAVFTDLCSTGAAAKGLTERGIFAIWRRVANETMDSTTIGIPKGDPKYYRLENVLYTQYFDYSGEALHYAWWHNNFGHPMSYGCVNLRLATARWFWDWANIGTRVVVA
jgi:lipoprotein-anchoring transpeptidase ErfK/SrfK